MSRRRRARDLASGLVVALLATGMVGPAAHAGTDAGDVEPTPVVVPGTYEFAADAVVDVTIAGFSSRTVTVALCGNAAQRGSADCNLGASESTRTNVDRSPRHVQLVASEPPVPCPCLIRVASPTNDEVVEVPVTLIGHPVAEPYGGSYEPEPLVASVRAEPAGDGLSAWLVSSLGGTRSYDVTVTVGNTSAVPATSLTARAFATRDGDVRVEFAVPVPSVLAAGETWEETRTVDLPFPTWGTAEWRVEVAGSRPTATATSATGNQPVLLFVLIGLFALDVLVLFGRWCLRRRRRARRRGRGGGGPSPEVIDVGEPAVALAERQLVPA